MYTFIANRFSAVNRLKCLRMLYLNPDVKYQKTQEHFTHAKIWINDPIVAIQNVCKATLPSSEQKLKLKTISRYWMKKTFILVKVRKICFFSLSVMPCICYILEINKSWSTIYAGKICTKKFLKRKWFIQTVICIPTRQGKRLRRENSKVINVAAHERSISIMAHYPFLKDSLAQFDYFWLSFKFLGKVLDWTCIWLI